MIIDVRIVWILKKIKKTEKENTDFNKYKLKNPKVAKSYFQSMKHNLFISVSTFVIANMCLITEQ